MLSFIKQLIEGGMSNENAILEGALVRLRPVVMTTALVGSLGFVPMAIATGTGAGGPKAACDGGHRRV